MVKEVLLLGNPKLYDISRPVKEDELGRLDEVVNDLHDTLMDFKKRYGAGRAIAAPQIGVMKRLIYMFILQKKILSRNQAELKAIAAKKETLNTQLALYQGKLEQLNLIKEKLDQLQMAVDVHQQNYRLYLTKFEESRISDAMDDKKITNVSLIEPALPPLKPVFPKVLLNIFLGIFFGGFGGLVLAFFTEYLDDSIEKPDDVEKVLQLPVLASIPET